MKEQVLASQTNRREMLKLSAMSVLGGVAAGALIPQKARAADAQPRIAYASWIHGHSMQIEYPDRIASERRAGFFIMIEGMPGTDNWFHFAIPTPVIINDVRLQPDSVMLCFQTNSTDALVQHVHVYDGGTIIAEYDDLNLSLLNSFVRYAVPNNHQMVLGLGISVGVSFGVEAMDHHMYFAAAGCDFVTPQPAQPA